VRAVIQRCSSGAVLVDGKVVGQVDKGFVVLLGIQRGDTEADAHYLAEKIAHLRVFPDGEGKLNTSLLDVGGEVLAVSQFTLLGDCRKGRRPSFTEAAPPQEAEPLYQAFVEELTALGVPVATGVFGAHMQVEITNDGPVTLLLESRGAF
jgi:D-tyrosyl-tRNA(Tyr) deacylase